jgi:hypothetical protein
MGTQEKLQHIKEILATTFLNATNQSIALGLQYKYESYPVEEDSIKGWCVDIIVKEAGYGERTIQTLRFRRPDNIDAKRMEYHVLLEVLTSLTMSSLLMWYEAAKILATDEELQKTIINETKKGDISSN